MATVAQMFRSEITESSDDFPGLFPSNRINVKTLQGLLLQRDYLAKKVASSKVSYQLLAKQNESIIAEFLNLLPVQHGDGRG